jgi:outer membrane protein assembly factor BamB
LAAAYDRVYFGSWNNTVYCLDADTGSEVWSCLTGDKIISSPAVADGMVYLGCMDGHFYYFDSDGNVLGDFKLGKVIGSPSISNGYVFVPAGSKLYCLGEKAQEIKETKTEENGNRSNRTYYILGAVIGIVILIAIGMKKKYKKKD